MKKLKLSLLIVLGMSLFISCEKDEDDLISQECVSQCTQIIGKFVTDNGNVPIPNLNLTVIWEDNQYLLGNVDRTKATTQTDSEGNFELNFLMRDDEFDSGQFRLYYEANENTYLSSFYKRIRLNTINRDTTLIINYNIPKKAFLNLSLLNLDLVQPPSNFSTEFIYEAPDGFTQSVNGQVIPWNFESNQDNLIEIPGNQNVTIKTYRTVDNITTTEFETIFLEAGTTLNYSIDFNN